jgi:hypothetical protein
MFAVMVDVAGAALAEGELGVSVKPTPARTAAPTIAPAANGAAIRSTRRFPPLLPSVALIGAPFG